MQRAPVELLGVYVADPPRGFQCLHHAMSPAASDATFLGIMG